MYLEYNTNLVHVEMNIFLDVFSTISRSQCKECSREENTEIKVFMPLISGHLAYIAGKVLVLHFMLIFLAFMNI